MQRGLTIFFVVMITVLVVLLTSCGAEEPSQAYRSTPYSYIVVDGMPCVYIYGDVSCDWSRWQGTVDGDEIIVKEK